MPCARRSGPRNLTRREKGQDFQKDVCKNYPTDYLRNYLSICISKDWIPDLAHISRITATASAIRPLIQTGESGPILVLEAAVI